MPGLFISGSWATLDPTIMSSSIQSLTSISPTVASTAGGLGGGFAPGFLGVPSMRIYKMRGWNTSTLAYEYWLTQYPGAPPPTGNTLQDIAIVATFIVG